MIHDPSSTEINRNGKSTCLILIWPWRRLSTTYDFAALCLHISACSTSCREQGSPAKTISGLAGDINDMSGVRRAHYLMRLFGNFSMQCLISQAKTALTHTDAPPTSSIQTIAACAIPGLFSKRRSNTRKQMVHYNCIDRSNMCGSSFVPTSFDFASPLRASPAFARPPLCRSSRSCRAHKRALLIDKTL